MSEYPILFSGKMIRAILDGKKSQTRRVVTKRTSICPVAKWSDLNFENAHRDRCKFFSDADYLKVYREKDDTYHRVHPRYSIGDNLWVRETFQYVGFKEDRIQRIKYSADDSIVWLKKKIIIDANRYHRNIPSIHMPKWAARIWLEITDIRVQLLQELTESDAKAEGYQYYVDNRLVFSFSWNFLNEKRNYSWDSNPWVWVIEFRKIEK